MGISDEGSEAIRNSNRDRNLRCKKCGNMGLKTLDGSQVGGLPGIMYKVCDGCGWTRAITKKQGKFKL